MRPHQFTMELPTELALKLIEQVKPFTTGGTLSERKQDILNKAILEIQQSKIELDKITDIHKINILAQAETELRQILNI